jgi:hypothetical protein
MLDGEYRTENIGAYRHAHAICTPICTSKVQIGADHSICIDLIGGDTTAPIRSI